MKAKNLHPELLQRLSLQESARAAKEKLEKVQTAAYRANKINEETVSSEPVIKVKSDRRKKNQICLLELKKINSI